MIGATPMTISVILEVSPSPMTMNRIGSSASGGTIEKAARTARAGPHIGEHADDHAEDERDHRGDAERREQAAEARQRVGPEQVLAGTRVGDEGHAG